MKEPWISRPKVTIMVMLVGFVLLVVFVLLSYIQKLRADAQTRLAVEHRMQADVQRQICEDYRNQLQRLKDDLKACREK